MQWKQEKFATSGFSLLLLVLVNIVILKQAFISHQSWYYLLIATLPLLLFSIVTYDENIK